MPKDQLQPELGSDGAAMLRPGANSVQHGVQRGHFTLSPSEVRSWKVFKTDRREESPALSHLILWSAGPLAQAEDMLRDFTFDRVFEHDGRGQALIFQEVARPAVQAGA